VSYEHKHNEENGECNRDGVDENYSHNYGVEGETGDPEIEAIRKRQIKNFLLTLLVSRGVPMLLGGDEFRRTQRGNNNAYCQDNETSWHNWAFLERHQEIYRFARGMIAFRHKHPVLSREAYYAEADIRWSGAEGATPNWSNPKERQLGCLIRGQAEPDLFLMFNAGTKAVKFDLPVPPKGERWHLAVDTDGPIPQDLLRDGQEIDLEDQRFYCVGPQSSAILISQRSRAERGGRSVENT
jgi:glycogen operon protein